MGTTCPTATKNGPAGVGFGRETAAGAVQHLEDGGSEEPWSIRGQNAAPVPAQGSEQPCTHRAPALLGSTMEARSWQGVLSSSGQEHTGAGGGLLPRRRVQVSLLLPLGSPQSHTALPG